MPFSRGAIWSKSEGSFSEGLRRSRGMSDEVAPEHKSVEAFGEFLLDDDRTDFRYDEAEAVALGMGVHPYVVVRALEAIGFKHSGRPLPKRVRGFTSNSHDRWYGLGSSPTHGGSGWEQISGFSGQEG